MNKGLASRKFLDKPYNYNIQNRDDKGNCFFFGEECHKKLVIYKLTCKECGYFYVGSTKNSFKLRAAQHFGDVKKLMTQDIKTDTFARHFKRCYTRKHRKVFDGRDIRKMTSFEILWHGNPLTTVKNFSTYKFKLCIKEKLCILNAKIRLFHKNINKRKELYSRCCHGGNFHNYCRPCAPQCTVR